VSDGAEFRDDESISDEEILYRRIPVKFVRWDSLSSDGAPKIPNQGFQDYPDIDARTRFNLPGACMSVGLDAVLAAHNEPPTRLLVGFDADGLVALQAGEMRALRGPKGDHWGQG
jgi:hypothetical protein